MRSLMFVAGMLVAIGAGSFSFANEPAAKPPVVTSVSDEASTSATPGRRPLPNLYAPTLGGWQFWTDEFVYLDWRIQRHCATQHCRLLDADNYRRAWGTYEECHQRFDELRKSERLMRLKPRVVIALHGLGHSRTAMNRMAESLRKHGEYDVLLVSYASTRADLETHAQSLANVVRNLDGVREIHFVAHSLGNLVLRHYLADETDEAQGKRPDPRIKRIVMLGPPNQGARLAVLLKGLPLFPQIVGPSGVQLTEEWTEVSRSLATPACEFGILAGGRGDERGVNPWVPGDDDLIVRVEETKLPGARDFRVIPCLHRQLLGNEKVLEYTRRFLEHGYFESEETRQPLTPVAHPDDAARRKSGASP